MFRTPSIWSINGTSGSGKTMILYRICLETEHFFDQEVKKVLFCYRIWQPIYDKISDIFGNNIKFKNALPDQTDIDFLTEGNHHSLLFLDDLNRQVIDSEFMTSIYQIQSHHKNMTLLNVSHNIYQRGRYTRDQSLCIHYFIILNSPRDVFMLKCIGRQIQPSKPNCVVEAYHDVMKNSDSNFPYILINIAPGFESSKYTLLSNVFKDEIMTVYLINS